VNALLDISKMESGAMVLKREPSNAYTIAETVAQELAPLALEMEVVVRNEIDSHLPLLDVDAEKIERVLLNLMDNAIKFTPGEGLVVINAHIEVPYNGAKPEQICVSVKDTGPGIPDEYKTRLFDRYVQVEGRSGRRRGTGLGLTFCRLTVEAHGGKIWIEDNPQGGSIFMFTLPIADIPALEKNPETLIGD
jgi:signal transduction histidine kinase